MKVKQDQAFNSLHDMRDPGHLLLQFDYSENAEVVEQDEVQSAHWWHLQVFHKWHYMHMFLSGLILQVSIFTACAWINGECQSFACVTNYPGHDKYSTLCILLTVIGTLLPKNTEVIIKI